MRRKSVTSTISLFAAILCTAGAWAQSTVIDTLDTAGNPPPAWTLYAASWGASAIVEGSTTHLSRTCTSMYLPSSGSSIIVQGFPIKPGAGPGHISVDVATPSTFSTHWIEVGYCIYETDPGAATAAAHFDGQDPYPGGDGHDNATHKGWRNVIKFDGWGLGAGNSDTWNTYSTADSGASGACGGGSCPDTAIVTTATESIIYIGFKVGNGGGSTGPVYYDTVKMDNVLIPPSPASSAVQGRDWRLYY